MDGNPEQNIIKGEVPGGLSEVVRSGGRAAEAAWQRMRKPRLGEKGGRGGGQGGGRGRGRGRGEGGGKG